jgi:hypothetical protein
MLQADSLYFAPDSVPSTADKVLIQQLHIEGQLISKQGKPSSIGAGLPPLDLSNATQDITQLSQVSLPSSRVSLAPAPGGADMIGVDIVAQGNCTAACPQQGQFHAANVQLEVMVQVLVCCCVVVMLGRFVPLGFCPIV